MCNTVGASHKNHALLVDEHLHQRPSNVAGKENTSTDQDRYLFKNGLFRNQVTPTMVNTLLFSWSNVLLSWGINFLIFSFKVFLLLFEIMLFINII